MPDHKPRTEPGALTEGAMIDLAIRLALLGLLVYWAGLLLAPFALILVWATILAVALAPVHAWLARRLGGRERLAAGLVAAVCLLVLFGPATALVTSLADTVGEFSAGLRDGTLTLSPPPDRIAELPFVGARLHATWSAASANLSAFLNQNSEAILDHLRPVLGSVLGLGRSLLGFAVAIVIAGFLFGRGEGLTRLFDRAADRVISERGHEFVHMAGATIRNVAQGVLGVAVLQTVLAGIGIFAVGAPMPGLFTLLILVLGIIQIGPALVVLVLVIWAWATLDPLTALMFTLYMTPVSLLDNVLKPIIMAKGLKTPMLVIFLGVIGGTVAHGLVGLFIGPIVLAVLYDLVVVWIDRARSAEASADAPADAPADASVETRGPD